MVALKGADIARFVARPDPGKPVALIFGPDAGLVRERTDALIRAAVEDPRDPFALALIDGDTLAEAPERLLEEAHTVPLFGGRRAVWVKAGGKNFTAAVERLLRVPRERICVVPNAVDDVFGTEGPRADGDYVLAVGTLEPRKNLDRTIEAAKLIGAEVRIVGASGWGRVVAHGANVTWLGRLDDRELARQYRGARCLAYPSLYEGFGFPVLDSLWHGTPVLCSYNSSLEEFTGPGVFHFDACYPFSLDAALLYERGEIGLALIYVLGSVLLSIAGLFAGLALMRHLA